MDFLRHLDLPSGGTVEFVDPDDLTGDDHRRIVAGITGDLEHQQLGMAMDVVYGTAAMLIESWVIPYAPKGTSYAAGSVPIPSQDFGSLGKLRLRDYHTIISAVGPVANLLFPREASPDQAGVPGSPTRPAGG